MVGGKEHCFISHFIDHIKGVCAERAERKAQKELHILHANELLSTRSSTPSIPMFAAQAQAHGKEKRKILLRLINRVFLVVS